MTIAATAITIDGDTAWLVVPLSGYHPNVATTYTHYNRPCDTCAKIRAALGNATRNDEPCLSCGEIDGRHTFTLDVAQSNKSECDHRVIEKDTQWEDHERTCPLTLSVHVVEVLPIMDAWTDWVTPCIIPDVDGVWQLVTGSRDGTECWELVDPDLPADAAPGMYAVRLAVHT
jgi:hypothetical protein